MDLEDRINDEMVVDAESFLKDHFEDANQLFCLFENGSIDIRDKFEDAPWRERILIHLIARRYAYEGNQADTPTLPYNYFYARIDKDESTIRDFFGDLRGNLIVEKDEESEEWKLVPDNLPEALSRIEGMDV